MAINPLQIPGYAAPQALDFSSLANLGNVYREGQKRQSLADLGRGLSDGSLDYRQAAAKAAEMGDTDSTLKFLALDEQRKKQAQEHDASNQFTMSLSRLYGGGGGTPAGQPSVGVPNVAPPDPTMRAPVASTPKVWGDDEAVAAGLYDPPAAQRTQLAQAQPMQGAPSAAPSITPQSSQIPVLLQAMSNPRLPAGQRDIAKALFTRALDEAKPPERIKMLQALQANPELMKIEEQLRAAGKTTVNVGTGEKEEEKAAGKGAGERRASMFAAAGAAPKSLLNLNRMEAILDQVAQGKIQPAKMTISAWAKSLGLDDEAATRIGLDPKGVGSAQALAALTNESVLGKIGPGGLPANNFSNKDLQFLVDIFPKLGDDPASNKIKIEGARRVAHFEVERAKEYQSWKKNSANKGKGFEDFELEWSEKIASQDRFGDLRAQAEKIAGSGTSAPAPQQQPKQAQDGNFYVPDPARPGKYLRVIQ